MRLNKVLIQGRLGGDPEITEMENGTKRATFSVAVDAGYKDDAGEWQNEVDWVRVVTFREKLIDKTLSEPGLKGRLAFIDGQLKTRSYEKDGKPQYMTEVQVGTYGTIALVNDSK
jgi:single-strand DNA-binding protein